MKKIPITIYEKIIKVTEIDYIRKTTMYVIGPVAIQNIGGDLYAIYTIK